MARNHLAKTLLRHRHELSALLMKNIADWDKFSEEIKAHQNGIDEYITQEFHAFVDYLEAYCRTSLDVYKHLYVGEKLKQLHSADFTPEQDLEHKQRVTEADVQSFRSFLEGKTTPEDLERLTSILEEFHGIITTRGQHVLNVLLIGDCLYLDVISFLTAPCLLEQISIRPTFAASKNPRQVQELLRELADREFDLIFYSPFTYEFSLEYASLMSWRKSFLSDKDLSAIVEEVMDQTESILNLLTSQFSSCPIFVHNSANVRRHDSSPVELAKSALTRRIRSRARQEVNARLQDYVSRRASETTGNLFILDEASLLEKHTGFALGRMLYCSPLQHPAVMGQHVAEIYRDILASHVHLMKKKLIVCDLDNTLWEGEIGEGSVNHFHGRQRMLKKLKEKGVLLAINSKNDPKNVHWDGSLLNETDFVRSQINWDSKAVNMKRIQQALNLNLKDFVFIDDRGDQRELIASSLPEVHVMDALSDRAWRLIGLWADILPNDQEVDRTQLYREREQRETFLCTESTGVDDPGQLFLKLAIQMTIREAKKGDLKRVVELINRTNQFNMNGKRTNLREAAEWHADDDVHILVVDGADKFGQMGLVCVAVVEFDGSAIRIPVFVLSCRVFGYGIENALLNAIKRKSREAAEGAAVTIVGLYKETSHNEPCRRAYPDNGFRWDGNAWIHDGDSDGNDLSWLTVHDQTASWRPRLERQKKDPSARQLVRDE